MIVRILKDGVRTSNCRPAKGSLIEVPEVEGKALVASGEAAATVGFSEERIGWPKLNRQMRPGAVLIR